MTKTPTSPEPATIDAYRLSRIVGLTERRLRQMSDEGVLPAPVRSRYPLAATLQALLKSYRDRCDNNPLQDSYPSFEACSKATGIPLKVLNNAKRLGCPALRRGRVDLGPFLRWYAGSNGRPPINLEAEQARFVALQNAKLKLMIGRLKGEEVLAQLDILDRTFKAWKEMADRAEQTLGGLQAAEHNTSTASV